MQISRKQPISPKKNNTPQHIDLFFYPCGVHSLRNAIFNKYNKYNIYNRVYILEKFFPTRGVGWTTEQA